MFPDFERERRYKKVVSGALSLFGLKKPKYASPPPVYVEPEKPTYGKKNPDTSVFDTDVVKRIEEKEKKKRKVGRDALIIAGIKNKLGDLPGVASKNLLGE